MLEELDRKMGWLQVIRIGTKWSVGQWIHGPAQLDSGLSHGTDLHGCITSTESLAQKQITRLETPKLQITFCPFTAFIIQFFSGCIHQRITLDNAQLIKLTPLNELITPEAVISWMLPHEFLEGIGTCCWKKKSVLQLLLHKIFMPIAFNVREKWPTQWLKINEA